MPQHPSQCSEPRALNIHKKVNGLRSQKKPRKKQLHNCTFTQAGKKIEFRLNVREDNISHLVLINHNLRLSCNY